MHCTLMRAHRALKSFDDDLLSSYDELFMFKRNCDARGFKKKKKEENKEKKERKKVSLS